MSPGSAAEVVAVEATAEEAAPTSGPAEEAEGEGEKAAEADGEEAAEDGEGEKEDEEVTVSPSDYRALLIRLAAVEAKVAGSSGSTANSVALAALAAANSVAVAAAKVNTHTDAAVASLSSKVDASFKIAVEQGVSSHADQIGSKLFGLFEERLHLARETAAGLSAIQKEVALVTKSLNADLEGAPKQKTVTGLERFSIFDATK